MYFKVKYNNFKTLPVTEKKKQKMYLDVYICCLPVDLHSQLVHHGQHEKSKKEQNPTREESGNERKHRSVVPRSIQERPLVQSACQNKKVKIVLSSKSNP